MGNSIIIVAGGSGKRMGTAVPKQFLEINGKALILYTIESFLIFDPKIEIVLVLNPAYYDKWEEISRKTRIGLPIKIAPGGETRFHSVKSGISMVQEDKIVGIHDSVRPFVSPETIKRVYDAAAKFGAAVPCVPMKESVRKVSAGKSHTLDRSTLMIVQTPQVFRSEILLKSYQTEYKESFTDDASVVEGAGYEICLVEGDEYNIKITTPRDFDTAKYFLTLQKPHQR